MLIYIIYIVTASAYYLIAVASLITQLAAAFAAVASHYLVPRPSAEGLKIGPLSRTARPLAHTNMKISSISIINYSTKMGDLLALQNALADLNLQEHPNISETSPGAQRLRTPLASQQQIEHETLK